MKAVLALGIIVVLGFLGSQAADPLYDAAARTICSNYAEDEGLVLDEARGMPSGRLWFSSFPDYSCRFRDSAGSTVFVDENDRLIEPTWTYRALRAAGWLAWIVGIVAGVRDLRGPRSDEAGLSMCAELRTRRQDPYLQAVLVWMLREAERHL